MATCIQPIPALLVLETSNYYKTTGKKIIFNYDWTGQENKVINYKKGKKTFKILPKDIKQYLKLPCGKCEYCIAQRKRVWSNRLIAHYKTMNPLKCFFITLTYEDNNQKSLNKKHLITFINSLKRYMYRTYNKAFKYFACGEYGEKYLRPHYHLILFDLDLDINDFTKFFLKDKTATYFNSELIANYWPKGYHSIALLNEQSISYTCGYVNKKLRRNKEEKEILEQESILPEFNLVSKNIGKTYIENNINELIKTGGYYDKGQFKTLGRYFTNYLKNNNYDQENEKLKLQKLNYAEIYEKSLKNNNINVDLLKYLMYNELKKGAKR